MMSGITCFNPTGISGPDGYINYKCQAETSFAPVADRDVDSFGWVFIILMVLLIIGKLFG